MAANNCPAAYVADMLKGARLRAERATGVLSRQEATLEPLARPTPGRAQRLTAFGLWCLALAALLLWLLIGSGCSTADGAADEPVPGAGRESPALSAPGPAAELLDALDTLEARAIHAEVRRSFWNGWKREPAAVEGSR
jgi:hypothetical protein